MRKVDVNYITSILFKLVKEHHIHDNKLREALRFRWRFRANSKIRTSERNEMIENVKDYNYSKVKEKLHSFCVVPSFNHQRAEQDKTC